MQNRSPAGSDEGPGAGGVGPGFVSSAGGAVVSEVVAPPEAVVVLPAPPPLFLHSSHVYPDMFRAMEGEMLTHLPWNQLLHMSQPM